MIVTVPDVSIVEKQSHKVLPILELRGPEATDWIPLQVIDAKVTFGEVGNFPLRSIDASIIADQGSEQNLISDELLTPYGAWVRAGQRVIRLDNTSFVVEQGVYRVDTVSLDQLTGEIKITGSDAGSMVEDDHLMTLNEGRVNTTETYFAALKRMIDLALRGITPFWANSISIGNASSTSKPKTTALQYEESRTDAVKDLAHFLTRRIISNSTWSGDLFKLIKPPVITDPIVMNVRSGEFGNLVANSYEETNARAEVFNCAAVKYTTRTAIGGGRYRVEEKRLLAEFADADSIVRARGPFGRPNRFAEANEIDNDVDAQAAARSSIMESFNVAREFAISTTPIYGIEPGDIVMVTAPGGAKTRGMVIGAEIPLSVSDSWQLTLRAFKMLDGSWTPRWYAFKDESDVIDDSADWRDFTPNNSTNIDLDDSWKRGWTAVNAVFAPTQATQRIRANGNGVGGMNSIQAWKDGGLHRFKASASVRSYNRVARARIGLDFNPGGIAWGPWIDFNSSQTRTLVADQMIPAASTTFGVRIQFVARGSSNAANGQELWVNNVQVEQAYIPT